MRIADPAAAPFTFVLTEPVRILAVDDDPIQREFASVYLATPTSTVDTAESAEIGLKMLAANAYDLALVDIDMPGMGGIEMVRAIRSTPLLRDMPVVMVTGLEDILSIDQSYEAGATSFVTKPVNWRLLTYHLRFVLRSQERMRANTMQSSDYAGLTGASATGQSVLTGQGVEAIRSIERAYLNGVSATSESG